jgi:hypothetical protein
VVIEVVMSGLRYASTLSVCHMDDPRRKEAEEWCREKFGEPGFVTANWVPLHYSFQFKNELDRTLFILRWS